jgi:uridylate kinase
MAELPRYGRALLKISGEALAGNRDFGFDPDLISKIAGEIAEAQKTGTELGIVIGGGNIFRGATAAPLGIEPVVGDHIGMVATVLNALVLRSALEAKGVSAHAMSAFAVGCFIELFERERALDYLRNGHVVIFAGGTGNPCFTTDSAAALRAVELDMQLLIKATQVRGVFDKDPRKHPDAVFFEAISPGEVLRRGLQVMDAASIEILGRKKIPTIVLDLHVPGNIVRALAGERVGTVIA